MCSFCALLIVPQSDISLNSLNSSIEYFSWSNKLSEPASPELNGPIPKGNPGLMKGCGQWECASFCTLPLSRHWWREGIYYMCIHQQQKHGRSVAAPAFSSPSKAVMRNYPTQTRLRLFTDHRSDQTTDQTREKHARYRPGLFHRSCIVFDRPLLSP